MRIDEMKRNSFYTDGENVIFKSKNGQRLLQLTKPDFFENDNPQASIRFADTGVDYAYASEMFFQNKDIRKVEKGEVLLGGWVKVIDAKNLEIYSKDRINTQYDSKGYITNFDELVYDEKWEVVNISKYMF